jgi:hypothetical protein
MNRAVPKEPGERENGRAVRRLLRETPAPHMVPPIVGDVPAGTGARLDPGARRRMLEEREL